MSRGATAPRLSHAILACAAIGAPFLVLAGEKTDVIVLRNGDRITGEIKELSRGKLRYKTDSMSTLYIEWDDVARVTSVHDFEIELDDGTRHFGSLVEPSADGLLRLSGAAAEELEMGRIVMVAQIGRSFWAKVDGSLSVGLSHTKASEVSQASISSDARYRSRKFLCTLNVSSITTTQAEEPDSTRQDVAFNYQRFRKSRWFGFGLTQLQRNDELGLDLRVLVAGGPGRHLIQSQSIDWVAFGGLDVTEEWTADSEDPAATALEAIVATQFAVFRYDDPEIDLNTTLAVFPSLTESGRVRTYLDVDARYEIVKDLFFELSGYVDHDSEPVSEEAEKTDWGVVTSLGWTF